jgi:hypothetical protein
MKLQVHDHLTGCQIEISITGLISDGSITEKCLAAHV